jgi:hypothetical protein
MSRQRYTQSELDARLKFLLGTILGLILLFTASGILYGLLFVTQPVGVQSENDKMFFNVLGSIATFITGTLAGILIGKSGADEIANMGNAAGEPTPAPAPIEPEPTEPEAEEEAEITGKSESQVPDEQPVDEDWDKN